MLTTHVFPEFTSQHGFLRARVSASGRFLERQGSMAKQSFFSSFWEYDPTPRIGIFLAPLHIITKLGREGSQWLSGRVLDS